MTSKFASIFNKKVMLQIYFIIFIILNVADFLNALSLDIDFFKKILSWSIIGFIFYKASPTKIFIGVRNKVYDFYLILAYFLISVSKSLVYYVSLIGDEQFERFVVFGKVLGWIKSLDANLVLNVSVLLGVILIVIVSFKMMRNLGESISQNSFIGSFELGEYLKFIKFDYVILILSQIFFATIIFNMIMEWFALAVDSVILVLGLIYYIFKYVHDHTTSKAATFLANISNTGNSFYLNLIEQFSNKKTILIGFSFLLALHLVVDVGVYLIPYSIGTENTLYFDSLDRGGNGHLPIFNFMNIEKSILFLDFVSNKLNIFQDSMLIVTYLIFICFFMILMILPFFIYYKNILKEKIEFSKRFLISFFLMLIFVISVSLIPNINSPLNFSIASEKTDVRGVDIYTQKVIEDKSLVEVVMVELVLLFLFLYLIYRYLNKNFDFLKDKLEKGVYIVCVFFFFIYICLFFFSSIQKDSIHLLNQNSFDENLPSFNEVKLIYENKYYVKDERSRIEIFSEDKQTKIKIIPFTNLKIDDENFDREDFDSYLYIKVNSSAKNQIYSLINYKNVILKDGLKYDFKTKLFNSNDIEMFYFLGKNQFEVSKTVPRKILKNNLDSKIIFNIINFKNLDLDKVYNQKEFKLSWFEKIRIYFTLIFTSFFYVFSLIAFMRFFIKTNLQNDKKF